MKSIKTFFDINLLKNIAIFALIYHLLFNTQLIYITYWSKNETISSNVINCAYYFFYTYIFSYIVFIGIAISRLINFWGTFLLFCSSAISSYYFYSTHNYPSYQTIATFLNGNIIDMIFDIGSVGLLFYFWIIFSLGVLVYSIIYFKIQSADTYFMKLLSMICILITLYNTVYPHSVILYIANPLNYLSSLLKYYLM